MRFQVSEHMLQYLGGVSGPGHIITILGQMKALLHVSGLHAVSSLVTSRST